MAEKEASQQQPVISIRISDALRLRLETLRKIISLKTGQTSRHRRRQSSFLSLLETTVLSW